MASVVGNSLHVEQFQLGMDGSLEALVGKLSSLLGRQVVRHPQVVGKLLAQSS